MKSGRGKTIAINKKARYQYEFLETYEAGLALTGTEVKSLRDGNTSLAEAYGHTNGRELFVIGLDIAPYRNATHYNHEPRRRRKLLLKRREINKLIPKITQRGLTLVPTHLYFSRGWVKLEIALARGRKTHDKRQALKKREQDLEIRRAMKKH